MTSFRSFKFNSLKPLKIPLKPSVLGMGTDNKIAVRGSIHEQGGPWTKPLSWTARKVCAQTQLVQAASVVAATLPGSDMRALLLSDGWYCQWCICATRKWCSCIEACSHHFWATAGVPRATLVLPGRPETHAQIGDELRGSGGGGRQSSQAI